MTRAPTAGQQLPGTGGRGATPVLQHGVLLEMFSRGVLITGAAGVGKSELALELLDRGHRLVADDCVALRRLGRGRVEGSSPPALQGFLALRSLGIIDIRRSLGERCLTDRACLALVLRLDPDREPAGMHPLHGLRSRFDVQGLSFPCITIPARDPRRQALLAETAVRDFLLREAGEDAAGTLVARQLRVRRGD